MNGYYDYSMSNRAIEAYQNGEKPLSKWTKKDIIDAIAVFDKEKAVLFKKLRLQVLKNTVLCCSSWHHTSCKFNKTNFYSVSESVINKMSENDIKDLANSSAESKEASVKYKGNVSFLEWSGSRKHPKCIQRFLNDVLIEEKGCFYLVYNTVGDLVLKKKIGSNGTFVVKTW